MTWIVREGVVGCARGTGRHLWGADEWSWNANGIGGLGIYTAGGGQAVPAGARNVTAWWQQGQCGALRYKSRDEAWRVAARVSGRVIKLIPRTPRATSVASKKEK